MPQMMPINWLISFFLFLLIFLMFNIMNYYILMFNLNQNYMKNKILKKNLTWKW